jgi:hypothetical protein
MIVQRLVLVCGHVCCLKTSLSLAVAPRLSLNLLATYGLGDFDPSSAERLAEARERRYRLLFELAEAYLGRGLSLWVDGNFPFRTLRSAVLDRARSYGVANVVILECTCSTSAVLEGRFERRRIDPAQPDAKAAHIREYFRSVSHFEELDPSEFEGLSNWEILRFDSCRRRMAERDRPTPFGTEICQQMVHCGFLTLA